MPFHLRRKPPAKQPPMKKRWLGRHHKTRDLDESTRIQEFTHSDVFANTARRHWNRETQHLLGDAGPSSVEIGAS